MMNLSALVLCTTAVWFVAPEGNDSADGVAARPFRTLARARDAARAAGGGVINLADGLYELDEPLELTATDRNLRFVAADGARPVVSAGRRIRGWTVDGRGWWHAKFPAGTRFSQFYVNGRRRFRPSLPRQGYFFIGAEASASPEGLQRFVCQQGQFDAAWRDISEIEVCVFHTWSMSRMPVRSYEPETRMLTLTHPSIRSPGIARMAPDNWYRLENVRAAFGGPGDWYLSPEGDLTYVPAICCEHPDTADCRASFLGAIVRGNGARDIVFRGIVFAHADWSVPDNGHYCAQAAVDIPGALQFEHCTGVRIERCAIVHTGGWGVSFEKGDSDCAVTDSELVDLGAGGVKIGCAWNGDDDRANHGSNCLVSNCLIRAAGRVDPAGVGVFVGHARDNKIVQNTICDLYYSGISVGWNWSFDETASGNLVENNHIFKIGQGVLSDMGGVYLLGRQPGTCVRCNRIHDIRRARNCAHGIYFDSGSSCMVVSNNVVSGCQDCNFFLASLSASNRVENNVFADAPRYQLTFPVRNEKSFATRFAHNVVWWRTGRLTAVFPPEEAVEFSGNVCWSEEGADTLPPVRGFTVVNPMFADPMARDFTLRHCATLEAIGVVPFSCRDAGRHGKEIFTGELPAIPSAFPAAPSPDSVPCTGDFEDEGTADVWPGWDHYPNAGGDTGDWAVRTRETAAEGTYSLKIVDCFDDYSPHFCAWPVRTDGSVRISFWWRLSKGARPTFEARDTDAWLGAPGPLLTVDAEGFLRTRDSGPLVRMPEDVWVKLEVAFRVGTRRRSHVYAVRATFPGETGPRRFGPFPLHEDFRTLGWVGFTSDGPKGSSYGIDGVVVR